MSDNDSDTFEVIAEKSFFIDHEPIVKEKKKNKKDPKESDTIKKPRRKKEKKHHLNFSYFTGCIKLFSSSNF